MAKAFGSHGISKRVLLKFKAKKGTFKTKTRNGKTQVNMKNNIKSVAYVRTSTKTNQHRGGKARATRATSKIADVLKDQVHSVIHEVVSGAAPLEERDKMLDLLTKKKHPKLVRIYCESARDVARDLFVGEAIYELSKRNNIEIIAADNPTLFQHDDHPSAKMMRRMWLVWTEYDKDKAVCQLKNGLMDKKAKSEEKSQAGDVKVQGRKTTLDNYKMTARQRLALNRHFKKYDAKVIGLRTLAKRMKGILKLKTLHHETARRMRKEFLVKRCCVLTLRSGVLCRFWRSGVAL